MKPNALKTAMIRATVKKGIRDIQENPKRGFRNLVELAEMVSGGVSQRDFFETVLVQLKDENSAYYRIAERIVCQSDVDSLMSFGIGLGYNALSHGASIIRKIEAEQGFNVPWCLAVELGSGAGLHPADLEELIEEGKEMGIYCYLFRPDADYLDWSELADLLAAQKDCAFAAFISPMRVDNEFCGMLKRMRNVAVLLNVDNTAEENTLAAAKQLNAAGIFYGGYSCFAGESATAPEYSLFLAELLKQGEALGLNVMVLARTETCRPSQKDDISETLFKCRQELSVPVLPIDLCEDLALADQAISSEVCLAGVLKDGRLVLYDENRGIWETAYNIKEHSLWEALQNAAPKNKAGTIVPA